MEFADLRGGLEKKRGGVFEEGGDTPMHTMRTNVVSDLFFSHYTDIKGII